MNFEPLHIAVVSETYPPEINGVALTVHGFEHGLRALGHRVTVVRPRHADDDQSVSPDHLLLPSLPLPRYPGLRIGLPARRRLQLHWAEQRPDVVYIATEGPLGWSALHAARRLGVPSASGFHTRFDQYMERYGAAWLAPLAFAWLRRFHNGSGVTLVPTTELLRFLCNRGFQRVQRLARAVDSNHFDPNQRSDALRLSWGIENAAPAVIHVGRIAAEKNLALAVQAYRAIQVDQPGARFVWVGDGPARPALAAANPDFVFAGVQRDQALARHFASADLFLFPSQSETFGNVTLEAMASGVPTVAFDYGAAREHLIDGEHGYAVKVGDDERFVRRAVQLAKDQTLRESMRVAGRLAILPLKPEHVAEALAELLHRLSRQRGTP